MVAHAWTSVWDAFLPFLPWPTLRHTSQPSSYTSLPETPSLTSKFRYIPLALGTRMLSTHWSTLSLFTNQIHSPKCRTISSSSVHAAPSIRYWPEAASRKDMWLRDSEGGQPALASWFHGSVPLWPWAHFLTSPRFTWITGLAMCPLTTLCEE